MHMGIRALCIVLLASGAAQSVPGQTHYDVIALRVEFQPDTTRYTTGDGTFAGLHWGLDPKVDPLPHGAPYFAAHLAFLADYVETVSSGHATLAAHLVPHVVRVAHQMGAYSPVGPEADSDAERVKLARLVQEAWSLADTSGFSFAGFTPERTFFVLFHAGIGRDVELLGTVLEKTPLDLPSLFFSEAALQRLGVTGLAYGALPITHTAIIPRTESRLGYNSITQDSLLLELSINGLLASSFLSYLGVPDLFNTATGASAIGGFGVMDPQGIFAYAGLFPPAPTAWTRARLGWHTPVQLSGQGPVEVTLSTGEIARAGISAAEYFLIENRQRDPEGDGLVLRVWQDGQVVEQHVEAITDDFNRFSVDGFVGGVVVGVDHYDFALPGWDADGNQYQGGMLIWHVDEQVIKTGQINADPLRRGVALEEADAAQDLGFDNTAGAPFDFFFEGNPVRAVLPSGREIRFYENRFGPATTPSSASNAGGESFIVFEDFSAPGPEMQFVYRMESAHGISLVSDIGLDASIPRGSSVGGGNGFSFVFENSSTPRVHVAADGSVATVPSLVRPLAVQNTLTALERGATGALVLRTYEVPGLAVRRTHTLPAALAGYRIRGPLVGAQDGAVHVLLDSAVESVVVVLRDDGAQAVHPLPPGGQSLAVSPEGAVLVTAATYVRMITGEELWTFDEGGPAAYASSRDGVWGAMVLPARNRIRILATGQRTWTIDVAAYVGEVPLGEYVTLADVDGDDTPEILSTAGPYLLGFTQGGAMAPGFPLQMDVPLSTPPLAVRRSSGQAVIIVGARSGVVYAVEQGRPIPGFPLTAGANLSAAPRLSEGHLEVATGAGLLRTYAIGETGAVLWGERHAGPGNAGFAAPVAGGEPPNGERLLVAGESYNWPNPIRRGNTFVRLMATEDATVELTVVDLAGTVVHEAAFEVLGGSPAEYQWRATVASGLYYARIRATAADGRQDTQLVRMAVIR